MQNVFWEQVFWLQTHFLIQKNYILKIEKVVLGGINSITIFTLNSI